MNIYREILRRNLPRLLSIYNLDPVSPTYGWGDRRYWGWKTADFVNGSFQGGVYALAVALRMRMLESEDFGLRLIDAIIMALPKIRRPNGAMEEAFPNENSFCVTAAVAADCLAALDCLGDLLAPSETGRYLEAIRPLILFIGVNDEQHAVISNHLAAAAAAAALWKKLSGGEELCGSHWLERIYVHSSREGWFREYEGADPGYQTLCGHYLGMALDAAPDALLTQKLAASAEFLKYCVHPDGTIGGLYGSRDTEVYYPSGCLCLSHVTPVFASIARELEQGVVNGSHILPEAIDAGNFIPLLNSYAAAAYYLESHTPRLFGDELTLPCKSCFEKDFPEAGLFIKSTGIYHAIINYRKGGTVKVFDKRTGRLDCEDGGLFGRLRNGKRFSSQRWDNAAGFEERRVEAGFYRIADTLPTPLIFLMVRFMSLFFFHFTYFRELFKKMVVHRLMTGKKRLDGGITREFQFFEEKILVTERILPPRRAGNVAHYGKVRAIHMASGGYYLKQLQQVEEKSRLVEFIPC